MTYTLRNIPDELWKQVKLNAETSGLPIRTYILLVLERSNVRFKLADEPVHADVARRATGKSNSELQLENGKSNSRFNKR